MDHRSPEPRWLDPAQREAWLGLLRIVTLLPSALDSQMQRDAGMTNFEYGLMSVLSEQPDRTMQLKELAATAHGSLSRLSHVSSRLEKRGWVRRRKCPDNSHITLLTLTEDGMRKVRDAAPAHVDEVQRLVFDHLDEHQVQQLAGITRSINTQLGQE